MVSISKANAKKVYSAFNAVQNRAMSWATISLGKTDYIHVSRFEGTDGITVTIRINGIFMDIDKVYLVNVDCDDGLRILGINSHVHIPYRG